MSLLFVLLSSTGWSGVLPSPGKICYDNCITTGKSHQQCLKECGY